MERASGKLQIPIFPVLGLLATARFGTASSPILRPPSYFLLLALAATHAQEIVTFDLPEYTVLESVGTAQIGVSRADPSGPLSVTYEVAVRTTVLSAASSPEDFSATSGVLTFDEGETSLSLPVSVVNDDMCVVRI